MGKIIIHKSFLGHIKIDGNCIDDKVKELSFLHIVPVIKVKYESNEVL